MCVPKYSVYNFSLSKFSCTRFKRECTSLDSGTVHTTPDVTTSDLDGR